MNCYILDFKTLICCYYNKSVTTNLNFLIFFATNFHLVMVLLISDNYIEEGVKKYEKVYCWFMDFSLYFNVNRVYA